MGFLNNVLDILASKIQQNIQGETPSQVYRDYTNKRRGYSVEAEISEALADLMLMFSSMPISGDSERAKWLDDVSDKFFRLKAKPLVSSAFGTGDAIVVPSWNGRSVQNLVVDSNDFVILGTSGDEITSCAYVVDRKTQNNQTYTLLQAIELVPYETPTGEAFANRYRMYITRNDSFADIPLSQFPDWEARFEQEWAIPNVDRLLIGRFKSAAVDPENLNSIKGVPICYGAGEPISEIHYLLGQMHNEFGLSEKAIMADKRLFQKDQRGDRMDVVLPRGKERLFVQTKGVGDKLTMEEWAPDIRYQAYLEAIDKQEQLVERAVGVSSGILSNVNDMNYQNVDNVRKSQQKTMSFISTARGIAEDCFLDLVYAWNVIANFYSINPMGAYDVNFDWSNEYVETFADRQNAILAGQAIGASDAVDYRMLVFDESPETARDRVEEIKAQKAAEPVSIEEVE